MADVTAATEHQIYHGTVEAFENARGKVVVVADAAINQV
jgi:hypothetical protein